MESIFEKQVDLKQKSPNELFGTSTTTEEKKQEEHFEKFQDEKKSPMTRKKDLWKNSLQNYSTGCDFNPLSPNTNPFVETRVSGSLSEGQDHIPKIEIKYEFSKQVEKFDNFSLSGCRESLIPVVSPALPSIPTPPPSHSASPDETQAAQEEQHIVLIVHGVMSSDASLTSNLEKTRAAFEQVRYAWFPEAPACHIELINWKAGVIQTQSSLFDRIIPRGSLPIESRVFVAYSISDVAFYLTPSHCEVIKSLVCSLLNERFHELMSKFPTKFSKSKVTLVGYSLGSVILHDILTSSSHKIDFEVSNVFFWGSPLAAYLSVKDSEFQYGKFDFPEKINVFNIYHPHDPVAFRIEPLFYYLDSEIANAEKIPHWETESFSSAWNSFLGVEKPREESDSSPLVPKRRLDYVLQESITESLSHQFSMLTAHHSYWSSRDVALFMLRRMNS